MNSSLIPALAFVSTLCFSFLTSLKAEALDITIDPGDLGTSFREKTIFFDDLNNIILDGNSLGLDFTFSDTKSLNVTFNDSDVGNPYNLELILSYNFTSSVPPFPPVNSGFLSDQNGNPIDIPNTLKGANPGFDSVVYSLGFGFPGSGTFTHKGIHFDITLPDQPTLEVTGGKLILNVTSVSEGQIQVVQSIPEPLTIVGAATALSFGTYFKRKLSQKNLS